MSRATALQTWLSGSAYVILGISGSLPNNSGGWDISTYKGCIHSVGYTCVIVYKSIRIGLCYGPALWLPDG